MKKETKAKLKKIIAENYYTDKDGYVHILDKEEYKNKATLIRGFEVLKDFLEEKGISWIEFLDAVGEEYQDEFMDKYRDAFLDIKDTIGSQIELNEEITDYIGDHIIADFTRAEWEEILIDKARFYLKKRRRA